MDDWPALKPQMPFQQVPVLELDDGRRLAQMAAIDRYCASLAGLLPKDPMKCAVAEMAYCFLEDVWQPISLVMMATYANDDEKSAAWKKLAEGALKEKLQLLNKHLEQRPGKFLSGDDELSYCDLSIFGSLSLFQSRWMKDLPPDILSEYPALRQFRHLVASLPEVAAYYRNQAQDDVIRQAFLPD
eukprot:gene4418-4671_t